MVRRNADERRTFDAEAAPESQNDVDPGVGSEGRNGHANDREDRARRTGEAIIVQGDREGSGCEAGGDPRVHVDSNGRIRVGRPKIDSDVRAEIWDKTGGLCWYCGEQMNPFRDFTIDHVVSIRNGGRDVMSNLVPGHSNYDRLRVG